MKRRTLLKLGAGSAVLLAVAGGSLALLRPGVAAGRLTPQGRPVFAAVARAVLDGSLPAPAARRDAALVAHMERLDATVAGLPVPVQKELSDLLALLYAAPGRLGLAGLYSEWAEASIAELSAMLQGLRVSGLALRQQTYHALRDLTNAAYFSDPSTWAAIGYPGPNPV